jgi:hypothetical protein
MSLVNTVIENTLRRVNKSLEIDGDTLNITCNFLYCNHQVQTDSLIIVYIRVRISKVG